MSMVNNVTIFDAKRSIAQHLSGNEEAGYLDVEPITSYRKFERGAFYTASDGRNGWKVIYDGLNGDLMRFRIVENV